MGKLRDIFLEYNIRPSKSLGQNFLIDQGVVARIVDAGGISAGDIVVEIGAGMGSLTVELAKKADKLLAIEIDFKLYEYLKKNLNLGSHVQLLNKDIMKLDLMQEIKALGWDTSYPIKVLANLPYYITTPTIMMLLEQYDSIKTMVLMMQSEVANRLLAKPGTGEYGSLTVAVGYYCKAVKVMDVSPHCFIPQPGVNSTVLKLETYDKPQVELIDKECFFRTVRASFNQRRKTLLNSLTNSESIGLLKEETGQILRKVGIAENARGETLDIAKFAELSNAIYSFKTKNIVY
ncbi:MAG: 16S rRNA (adenine(1518)-N(6)/adenine(1519)-N(6))-dimethyltransferase RsmA [Eubacteriales bacterium]|nr:16S rRNA (adenine(1518)-N(6)/adenine(1519)-N(6))-dimethyltransferase RsmA [Eubacteriales bacterium]